MKNFLFFRTLKVSYHKMNVFITLFLLCLGIIFWFKSFVPDGTSKGICSDCKMGNTGSHIEFFTRKVITRTKEGIQSCGCCQSCLRDRKFSQFEDEDRKIPTTDPIKMRRNDAQDISDYINFFEVEETSAPVTPPPVTPTVEETVTSFEETSFSEKPLPSPQEMERTPTPPIFEGKIISVSPDSSTEESDEKRDSFDIIDDNESYEKPSKDDWEESTVPFSNTEESETSIEYTTRNSNWW